MWQKLSVSNFKWIKDTSQVIHIHIRNWKYALSRGLVLEKVRRVIKLNQNVWLKPHVDRNTDLRKKAKNDFEKYFFQVDE